MSRPTNIVEVDFVNDPSSVTETWTNITAYVRAVDGQPLADSLRGRNYERALAQAGSLTMTLDNTDGRFDPANLGSPYYTGTANPASAPGLVTPKRRIRWRTTWSGVTYNLWRGYVEEWPQSWTNGGFYGESRITCSDALAVLAKIDLFPIPLEECLLDNPVAFYRLDEASNNTSAGNIGNITQPTTAMVHGSTVVSGSASVVENFTFGGQQGSGRLAADPTTSLNLTPAASTNGMNQFGNTTGYALQTVKSGIGTAPASTGSWTIECWLYSTGNSTDPTNPNNSSSQVYEQLDGSGTIQIDMSLTALVNNYAVGVRVLSNGVSAASLFSSTVPVTDNTWHHLVATLAADGKTLTLYVDGVSQGSAVAAGALAWSPPNSATWGGSFATGRRSGKYFLLGDLKNIGIYNTALSAARITAHFNAGPGWSGDDAGGRIVRLLDYSSWPSALRNIATGNSTCGTQLTDGTKSLSSLQEVEATELGFLFIDGQGRVAFTNRYARHSGTSLATFGENAAGGEFPYLEGIGNTQDPREIYNDVTVTRATGPTVHNITTLSESRYFPNSLSQATVAIDDASIVYTAQYLSSRYASPATRIPQIILDAQSNPNLWPQVLGREIGDRITVTRRPPNRTITADYFIEAIAHNVTSQTWKTTWLLSPASLDAYLKLDSSTYGRLGDSPGVYTVSGGINASVTSMTLAFASGSPPWTTAAGDMPLTIQVGSEQMTVSAAATAGATTQVLTIARGANGSVAATHSGGAVVRLVNAYPLTL